MGACWQRLLARKPLYHISCHRSRHLTRGGLHRQFGEFLRWGGFAPFGQTVSGSTSDRFRFTGLEFDTFTGLDHATARQSHPNQGRWISPDPFTASYNWADPQSLNRYGYVDNPIGVTGTVGGCVGAAVLEGANPIADIQCGIGFLATSLVVPALASVGR